MGAVVGRDETQPEDWRWGYDTVPFVIPLSYAPKWRNNNLFRFSTKILIIHLFREPVLVVLVVG